MFRSALWVTLAVFATACTFKVDRTLGPGEIRGTLVFESSGSAKLPAVGATVTLENGATSVQTDARGAFVLRGLQAGSYDLTMTSVESATDTPVGLRIRDITLAAGLNGLGDGRDLGVIAIGAFGTINGTVVGPTQTVPAGTVVTIPGIAQMPVAGGTFQSQALVPGDYDLTVFALGTSGAQVNATPVRVTVPRAGSVTAPPFQLDILAAASTGSISGIALITGAGSNAAIAITLTPTPAGNPSVTTDDSGIYSVTSIPSGIYAVTAELDNVEVSVPFVVVGGGTTTVPTITLPLLNGPTDAGVSDAGPSASQVIANACQNLATCNDLGSDSSETACELRLTSISSQLTDAGCAAAAAALLDVESCRASETCTALLMTNDTTCNAQTQALQSAAQTDGGACESILSAGSGADGGTDGGSMADAGTCTGVICGGACVDLNSDINNCGACNNVCTAPTGATASCSFKACLVTIATNQQVSESIVVDGTRAYWMAVDISGGGSNLIVSAPLAGGAVSTLVTLPSGVDVGGLSQDGQNLYWGDTDDVMAWSKAGGTVSTILSDNVDTRWRSAVDSSNFYWTNDGAEVKSVPLSGGATATLASGQGKTYGLAVDTSNVYWTDTMNGLVLKMPKAGGATVTLASGQINPKELVIDSSFVYWANYGDPGDVVKVAIAGGSPTTLINTANFPTGIAVDATYAYEGNYGDGTIWGVPLAGGAVFRVSAEQANPTCLSIDSTRLYWSTSTDIVSTPKDALAP